MCPDNSLALSIVIGSLFANRFRLNALSAEGGTATVYSAFDTTTKKIVALKVFSSESMDPDIVNEIWHREARALEKLDHPAIVQFIIAGRDDNTGKRYIALEWLDGKTLEAALKERGQLSWEQFYELFGQSILDALCFSFEANVIHRD